MKAKIKRGSGFRGALEYILDESKGAELIGGNLAGTTARELAQEFGAVRRLRPEIEKPVWHCSLSLPPGEKLDDEQWSTIAQDFLQRMGFNLATTPWVIARHRDTDKDHIHIVDSRIGLDGQVWAGEWDVHRAIQATQELEKVYGLTLTPGLGEGRAQKQLTDSEINMAVRTGTEPPRQKLQKMLDEAMTDKPTAVELAERLQAAGVAVRANIASTGKMSGFSFELDGIPFKASDLGKKYTWGNMQKAGIEYDQTRDRAGLERFSTTAAYRGEHQGIAAGATADTGRDESAARSDGGPDSTRAGAAGPGDGDLDGRDAADAGRAEQPDQDRSGGIQQEDQRGGAAIGSSEREGAGRGAAVGASSRGAGMAADAVGSAHGNIYGGAGDRVLALASTAATDQQPDQPRRGSGSRGPAARDRTIEAIQRQVEALGIARYEVGIREQASGKMMNRTWSRDELEQSISWLKRQNARGNDIYIRPAGDHGLILVDDLKPQALERMKADGLQPAAEIETSPGNYQAWVKLSPKPLAPEIRKEAARELAHRYGGDPNSADARHYGRLAGFTNRKPQHERNGRSPFVLVREAAGRVAVAAGELLQRIQSGLDEIAQQKEARERHDAIANYRSPGYGWMSDPIHEYRRRAQELMKRYGEAADTSRIDWMVAKSMASSGKFSAEGIEKAIRECSPNIENRKKGHEDDYARRTAQKAWELPEVRAAREKVQAQGQGRSNSRGMER